MNQRVIVIGHSFTSRLGLIRSVGAIGCRVTIIAMVGTDKDGNLKTVKPIDSFSKYVDHIYYCHLRDEERLISILTCRIRSCFHTLRAAAARLSIG